MDIPFSIQVQSQLERPIAERNGLRQPLAACLALPPDFFKEPLEIYCFTISGKLLEERFIKPSRDYGLEQTNFANLVEQPRQEVKEQGEQNVNVRQFIAAIRKYTDMQQLEASVLREFVEKMYIS